MNRYDSGSQGTADVITAGGMLVDLKTASKKPAGVSSSHALQLTTYAMLADQVNAGKTHNAARLYTITKTKTPAVVQQTVEITAEDRAYAEYIYPAVQEARRRGEVLPRRSSNRHSRKHCAYRQQCQADYGGEVRQ
jgi:CRISPR/Cas system-associated exonuclease Cas4 (RecB family)